MSLQAKSTGHWLEWRTLHSPQLNTVYASICRDDHTIRSVYQQFIQQFSVKFQISKVQLTRVIWRMHFK